jgi:ferredoxin-nitrite reductase
VQIQGCAATVMERVCRANVTQMLRVRIPCPSVPAWYSNPLFSLRRMGRELKNLVSVELSICPDIYHPAIARDGLLTRLRIPGGVLNESQCLTIAQLLSSIGLEYLQVTNRANLQLRSLAEGIAPELLTKLAECGLAADRAAVDGIRNIMLSPTAGIDPQELIDVRPLAAAWHEYLHLHPELGILSTKFSVGFDGGGSVSILDRPNDITLSAVGDERSGVGFSLHLGIGDRGDAPSPVGVRLTTDECLPMLAAIAQSYRQGIARLGGDTRRKPRLRAVIRHDGLAGFGDRVRREFTGSRHFVFKNPDLDACTLPTQLTNILNPSGDRRNRHLGVHEQSQAGVYYLGIVLPLGRWPIAQIVGLGKIATQYGSGHLRLTPWQNVIIPDVNGTNVAKVQGLISELGLVQTANHPSSLLRACAGATGCQFSATDTQADAIALADYLATNFQLERPLNIHFSGCDKSCAQHDRADLTLWGETDRYGQPAYRLEIGGVIAKLEREWADLLPPERVPIAIGNLIAADLQIRIDPQ